MYVGELPNNTKSPQMTQKLAGGGETVKKEHPYFIMPRE
jgi:hypothetical protein